MKQLVLLFFSILLFKNANTQELYSIQLIDSIPMHFNYATNIINNWSAIQSRVEQLSALKEGHLIVNAYTDSVGTIEYNIELGAKRLTFAMEAVQQRVHQGILIYSANKQEGREQQPVNINDTLFRRADVLVYEKKLNIEYNKPYPLPINFDGNQSYLREEAKLVIDKMIVILQKYPELKIELHGHVSGHLGDYPLSLNRTLSVKEYMVQRGIWEERITGKGFDNKKKLYYEEPWENNPLNRRVEIIFIKSE